MHTTSIRPSTVDGIKQLAKKIKRERNLTYTEALDAASRQAGYENFVHARRQLSVETKRVFPVYLSVHWRTPRDRGGGPVPGRHAGREILQVNLSRPLAEVVAKHRVSTARGLHGFRMEYADHLEHQTNVMSVENAREALLTAARSLRFMEATGLQPITTQKLRDASGPLEDLPGRDHTSRWFDPATDGYVLLDEPYARAIESRSDERQQWLAKRNVYMQSPAWDGIYFPGECPPHLVSPDGALLQRVSTALITVAPLPMPQPWPHETGLAGDDFVSPQRQADAKPRKPRPGPSYREHQGAVPYGGAPGIRSRWRPSKPMPLELHRQLGGLMQRLSEIGFSARVGNKLSQHRSLLEDWALTEHAREHGPSVANDLYYGGPSRPYFTTHAGRLDALTKAKALVENGYDDCKPRRELIAALNAAAAEIKKAQ